jgi:hypothetical protein
LKLPPAWPPPQVEPAVAAFLGFTAAFLVAAADLGSALLGLISLVVVVTLVLCDSVTCWM